MSWFPLMVLLVCPLGPAERATSGVRVMDARVADLLEFGLQRSAAMRAMVARLRRSDVVVYLQSEPQLPARLEGQLKFVTATAGLRYVVVEIGPMAGRSMSRQVAALGHELQHAVEIAGAPEIVDERALARAYDAFGFASAGLRAFESRAAIDAGRQVYREMTAAHAAE